jgi:hypothetical protein
LTQWRFGRSGTIRSFYLGVPGGSDGDVDLIAGDFVHADFDILADLEAFTLGAFANEEARRVLITRVF